MSNDKQFIDFKKEVEKLKEIDGAEEYAKQLAHLFLGNGLSLQTILLMAIDFGQQHPNWIPVEEELPEEGQVVLIYTKGGSVSTACYTDGRFDMTELLEAINVTHWMEIQPPRKGGQGMSCYDCKHYEPWGGLGDVTLQHYCGKDGQIGVRCNPSESKNCNGYKPRKEN